MGGQRASHPTCKPRKPTGRILPVIHEVQSGLTRSKSVASVDGSVWGRDAIKRRAKEILNHLGVRAPLHKIGDLVLIRQTKECIRFDSDAAAIKRIEDRWGLEASRCYDHLNAGPWYKFVSPIKLTFEQALKAGPGTTLCCLRACTHEAWDYHFKRIIWKP